MVVMPEKPAAGKRIPSGWFSRLWNALYSAANITGDGRYIMVQQTPAGTSLVFNDRNLPAAAGGGAAGGGAEAEAEYMGPFAIHIDSDGWISMTPGVVVINGITYTANPDRLIGMPVSSTQYIYLRMSPVTTSTSSNEFWLERIYSLDSATNPSYWPLAYIVRSGEKDIVRQIQYSGKITVVTGYEVTL